MIINGEKFACQSCVKGHRVSNCNHTDRPLQPIAPKGRPVKQCDHCRDARKAKSHHTKCDCGSKRGKEKAKGEVKTEDHSCCCHKGDKCVCGNKAEATDLRLETSLSRPTLPVKSKPKLVSSNSENAVPSLGSGPHRPLHRHNNSAQLSGQPYRIPRPHSMQGAAAFAQASRRTSNLFGRSLDDMVIDGLEDGDMGNQISDLQDSHEAYSVPSTAADVLTFDWEKIITSDSKSACRDEPQGLELNQGSSSDSWFDSTWNTVTDTPIDFTASPNFMPTSANLDLSIPSAPVDFFSPADLPLTSNPANPAYANYVQPISNSGESGFQSLPGLTTASSNPRSESGEPFIHADSDALDFWGEPSNPGDLGPFHDSVNSAFNRFSFNEPQPKYRPISHHSDSFSIDTSTSMQSDRVSNSSTIGPSMVTASGIDTQGVNAGHMENLATLRNSFSISERMSVDYGTKFIQPPVLPGPMGDFTGSAVYNDSAFTATAEPELSAFDIDSEPTSQAIIIPVGTDDAEDSFSWNYSASQQIPPDSRRSSEGSAAMVNASNGSTDYDWLQ